MVIIINIIIVFIIIIIASKTHHRALNPYCQSAIHYYHINLNSLYYGEGVGWDGGWGARPSPLWFRSAPLGRRCACAVVTVVTVASRSSVVTGRKDAARWRNTKVSTGASTTREPKEGRRTAKEGRGRPREEGRKAKRASHPRWRGQSTKRKRFCSYDKTSHPRW